LIFLEDHVFSPRLSPEIDPFNLDDTKNDNDSNSNNNNNKNPKIDKAKSRPRVPTTPQQREQEILETELIMEGINAIASEDMETFHKYYCIKQHLWYRASPLYENDRDDDDDDDDNDNEHDDPHPERRSRKRPTKYKIDIGMAPRSLESIGDILCLTLFNNSRKEGGPKLPELNSRRDHFEPYKKIMKTTLPYEEGEMLFAVVWEGIEEDKKDHEFYLVTGRNIWRSPIRGIATLNMEYIDRNWTTDPPTVDTVLLSIVCTSDDYYYKVSHMYDGPIIVPDVENSTYGPNRQKKRVDRSRTMNMDNDSLEEFCHPWVSPIDYNTYMEANPPS
jgi:hypothetical protein